VGWVVAAGSLVLVGVGEAIVGFGAGLAVTVTLGVGLGRGSSAAAIGPVAATNAASTAEPAVTRIPSAQRTTHVFLKFTRHREGTRHEPLLHVPLATIGAFLLVEHPD
jgi:hypothetical protein